MLEKALAAVDRVDALVQATSYWNPGPARPIGRSDWNTPVSVAIDPEKPLMPN